MWVQIDWDKVTNIEHLKSIFKAMNLSFNNQVSDFEHVKDIAMPIVEERCNIKIIKPKEK